MLIARTTIYNIHAARVIGEAAREQRLIMRRNRGLDEKVNDLNAKLSFLFHIPVSLLAVPEVYQFPAGMIAQ